jgi:sporulation protein YlmC with PRC-barrel domain
MISRLAVAAMMTAFTIGSAGAQLSTTQLQTRSDALSTLPTNAMTVTEYYKQNVYDPSNAMIGEISDVLVNKEGKIEAFIVSVGGFLGIGEKDVAVPFNAVGATERDGKKYLTMNTTKDALKSAHGFRYDRTRMSWDPA